MSIIRIPFEPHHLDLIEPDPVLANLKARMKPGLLMQGQGMSWIDRDSGEVIMIGGYIVRRPGVGWLWFLPSPRGSRSLLTAARFFKQWIATLDPNIRLEAHVLADFKEGIRWAEFLGLQRETGEPMRKWDGHEDYHLFARVTGHA